MEEPGRDEECHTRNLGSKPHHLTAALQAPWWRLRVQPPGCFQGLLRAVEIEGS